MSVTLFINNEEVNQTSWTFPGGERNVRIQGAIVRPPVFKAKIHCLYKSSDDLVDIILLTNAVRQMYGDIDIRLDIPYFPFARNDRVMVPGEPHALQAIVEVINMLNFSQVRCDDPHSEVLQSLFPAGKLKITSQSEIWSAILADCITSTSALVAPDAGAAKKIYALANYLHCSVLEASKVRDPYTGVITGTSLNTKTLDINKFDTLYVVDDICDGGYTFVELAKVIRACGYTGKLILCVTHGIFSKGLQVLEAYDEIHTKNNLSTSDLDAFNSRP